MNEQYASRGGWRWLEGQEEHSRQFFLDWRPGEALPAAKEVAVVTRPLHLRAPYNTKSLGHLIRDNLQFLIDLPIRFGRDPADFDWVRPPPTPHLATRAIDGTSLSTTAGAQSF